MFFTFLEDNEPFEIGIKLIGALGDVKVVEVKKDTLEPVRVFKVKELEAIDNVDVPEVAVLKVLGSQDKRNVDDRSPVGNCDLEERPKWDIVHDIFEELFLNLLPVFTRRHCS